MARVLLFGKLADIAGWRARPMAAATIAALTDLLAAEDPALGEALRGPGVQVALDQQLVRGDAALGDGSEVAFLPPMSGG